MAFQLGMGHALYNYFGSKWVLYNTTYSIAEDIQARAFDKTSDDEISAIRKGVAEAALNILDIKYSPSFFGFLWNRQFFKDEVNQLFEGDFLDDVVDIVKVFHTEKISTTWLLFFSSTSTRLKEDFNAEDLAQEIVKLAKMLAEEEDLKADLEILDKIIDSITAKFEDTGNGYISNVAVDELESNEINNTIIYELEKGIVNNRVVDELEKGNVSNIVIDELKNDFALQEGISSPHHDDV